MPRSYEPADVARRLRAHDASIWRAGKLSETASERAAAQGHDAGNVEGGMGAWTEAGLPVRRRDAAA